jgi:hypothetical protein
MMFMLPTLVRGDDALALQFGVLKTPRLVQGGHNNSYPEFRIVQASGKTVAVRRLFAQSI